MFLRRPGAGRLPDWQGVRRSHQAALGCRGRRVVWVGLARAAKSQVQSNVPKLSSC